MSTPTLAAGVEMDALTQRLRQAAGPSPVAAQVCVLLDDPAATLAEVAAAVALDPTLALRLVRAVNAAYFAQAEPVRSLTRAIQLLGFDALRDQMDQPSLVHCFALRLPGQAALNVRLEGLWLHSAATTVAAGLLAERLGANDATELLAAALLHDVGKAALLLLRPVDYERAVWLAASEGLPLVQAERRSLTFDHAQLGRHLCLAWGLPESVAGAVGRHHSVRSGGPLQAYSPVAAAVQVADILARSLGLGWWGDRVMPRLEPAARAALDLAPDDAADLLAALEDELPRAVATLHSLVTPVPLPAAR